MLGGHDLVGLCWILLSATKELQESAGTSRTLFVMLGL